MKKAYSIFLTMVVLLSQHITVNAKTALLVAHYGSSDMETREATINKITSDIQTSFPDIEVREAYISPIVRKHLRDNGISVKSPTEALLQLQVEGYDTVYVQSTTLIDGQEMAEVTKSVEEVKQFFKFLKTGTSLLYSPEDCSQLVDILANRKCTKGEVIIYVGHGNLLPSTATYTQLDYMFANKGYENFHVSTIEGYPDVSATINELKEYHDIRKVTLIPLLLVCGNHTKYDIAVDFSKAMETAGYEVEVEMRGLAENQHIRNLYVERVKELLTPAGY